MNLVLGITVGLAIFAAFVAKDENDRRLETQELRLLIEELEAQERASQLFN